MVALADLQVPLSPLEARLVLEILVRHATSGPAAMLDGGPALSSAIRKVAAAVNAESVERVPG